MRWGRLVVDGLSGDLRGFDDADDAPALELRKRTGLHDLDLIARLALVLFVVSVQDGTALDFLPVDGVRNGVLEVHLDGFVARAGGDET